MGRDNFDQDGVLGFDDTSDPILTAFKQSATTSWSAVGESRRPAARYTFFHNWLTLDTKRQIETLERFGVSVNSITDDHFFPPSVLEGDRRAFHSGITFAHNVMTNEESQVLCGNSPRLWAVVNLVELHGAQTVELETLARTTGLSSDHLRRLFRRWSGESIATFARRARARVMSALVRGSSVPLKQIAAGAGYADNSNFTRDFRSMFLCTPGRYRRYWCTLMSTSDNR